MGDKRGPEGLKIEAVRHVIEGGCVVTEVAQRLEMPPPSTRSIGGHKLIVLKVERQLTRSQAGEL